MISSASSFRRASRGTRVSAVEYHALIVAPCESEAGRHRVFCGTVTSGEQLSNKRPVIACFYFLDATVFICCLGVQPLSKEVYPCEDSHL